MPDGAVTRLFSRWRAGEAKTREQLLSEIYDELRSLADTYLRRERRGHTLQPTELVNEAFARLLGAEVEARDRIHFFALAARAMRRVLVDHARKKKAAKRPDSRDRVTLGSRIGPLAGEELEILELHDALERFAAVAPRAAKLVELRFFGGLENREVAEVLGVSMTTLDRDRRLARVWLGRELSR